MAMQDLGSRLAAASCLKLTKGHVWKCRALSFGLNNAVASETWGWCGNAGSALFSAAGKGSGATLKAHDCNSAETGGTICGYQRIV